MFTFGGGNGFQTQYRRPRAEAQPDTPASPLMALLPLVVLFVFVLVSVLPSLLSGPITPDPDFTWEPTKKYETARNTWHWGVPYHVNRADWEGSSLWESVPEERRHQTDAAMFSSKVRAFERSVESHYVRKLQSEVSVASKLDFFPVD